MEPNQEEKQEIVIDNQDDEVLSKSEESKPKKPKKKFKFTYKLLSIIIYAVLCLVIAGLAALSINLHKINENENILHEQIVKTLVSAQNSISSIAKKMNALNYYFQNNYIYEIDDETLESSVMKAYVETINDKYAKYFTKEEYLEYTDQMAGSSSGIGVLVRSYTGYVQVLQVFEGSPADTAGIKAKDKIIGTDSLDFSEFTYQEILSSIKGDAGTFVNLKIDRDGETIYINVERNDYTVQTVFYSLIEENDKKVGLIRISDFYANTPEEFYNIILQAKEDNVDSIIFDLRDNPGGYLTSVTKILDYLLPEGPIVHINMKDESSSYTVSSDAEVLIDVPKVILINENTASAAELFTSSLKDYRSVTIVGMKSYGKGCGQSVFYFSDGSAVKLTTFLYDPPYSENYNGVGISPDVEVELEDKVTPLLLLDQENDNQLQTAIKEASK